VLLFISLLFIKAFLLLRVLFFASTIFVVCVLVFEETGIDRSFVFASLFFAAVLFVISPTLFTLLSAELF
jgi:hypothetical protein